MKKILDYKKIITIVVALCIALVSIFYLGEKYSDPSTYGDIIQTLDEKKDTVLGLTASISGVSFVVSAIPDDAGTPIANSLANLGSYLLIVLIVIYLEKYLLTVIAFGAFKIFIPFACILYIIYVIFPSRFSLRKIAYKLAIFSVCILLLIPTSIGITNMIDETYEASIETTLDVENTEQIEENVQEQAPSEEAKKEELKWYERLLNTITNTVEEVKDTVSNTATATFDKVKYEINKFIEATAVMVVTSCAIPILTALVFIWLSKTLLGIDIPRPKPLKIGQTNPDPKQIEEHHE